MSRRVVIAIGIPAVVIGLLWYRTDPRSGSAEPPGPVIDLYVRCPAAAGVFAVVDAANPPDDPRPDAGYVALWRDYETKSSYVFKRLIFKSEDVGHALINLEKYLEVDLTDLKGKNPDLADAVADAENDEPDDTSWTLALHDDLAALMEFDPNTPAHPEYLLGDLDGNKSLGSNDCLPPVIDEPCLVTRPLVIPQPDGPVAYALIGAALSIDCQPDPDECLGGDRCCQAPAPCCQSPDPCCSSADPCCGSGDDCCNADNPCCLDPCGDGCDSYDAKCAAGCTGTTPVCCDTPCAVECTNDGAKCEAGCSGASPECCKDPCAADCDSYDAKCAAGCDGTTQVCCDTPCAVECTDYGAKCEAGCSGTTSACCEDPCGAACDSDIAKCQADCDGAKPECCDADQCDPACGDPCDPSCIDCDDGNPCTQDSCSEGTCQHICRPDCATCPRSNAQPGICVACGCTTGSCSLSQPGPLRLCPGGTAEASIQASCAPACGSFSIAIDPAQPPPPGVTVSFSPAGGQCSQSPVAVVVTVSAGVDAVPGAYTIGLLGTGPGGSPCPISIHVDIVELLDLTFDPVPAAEEVMPGGFMYLNEDDDDGNNALDWLDPAPAPPGEDNIHSLRLSADTTLTVGVVELRLVSGSASVRVYAHQDRTELVQLPRTWQIQELPVTLWVEGVSTPSALRGVEFRATYEGEDEACEDRVKLTVMRIRLPQVTFLSDHGVLVNNNSDWTDQGQRFGEPEWKPEAGVNYPISHTMGQKVRMKPRFTIQPSDAPLLRHVIAFESETLGFGRTTPLVLFLKGGANEPEVESATTIERTIQRLEADISWGVLFDARSVGRADTGPHVAYVTMGPPRDVSDSRFTPTQRRMERAVEQAGSANSLNPHEIVRKVIENQGEYDLDANQFNAWLVPDNHGDCGSIVRFARKVLTVVNVPGTIERKNIFAIETAPFTAIEGEASAGLDSPPRSHPAHPDWHLYLKDGGGKRNSFEAVAKFNACGETRYYAGGTIGGTTHIFSELNPVLNVFVSLSWFLITQEQEEVAHYPALGPSASVPACTP